MKKIINRAIRVLPMAFFVILATACTKRPETVEEFKEAFYQDKSIFESVCEKAYQYEWTEENLKKGIIIFEKPQLKTLGMVNDFVKKYRFEYVAVNSDINDDETKYVSFSMADSVDGYRYSTIYYSPTGEPFSIELGDYQEDLGMYYYLADITKLYECYTERLDDHWFFVRYHYF